MGDIDLTKMNETCTSHCNINFVTPFQHVFHRIGGADKTTTFVINVCKPVLYGHKDMCPPGSSVCLENSNELNLSKKLVTISQQKSSIIQPEFLTLKISH